MWVQALLQRPQPETIDLAPPPFSPEMWRRYMMMRWITLGANTAGVL